MVPSRSTMWIVPGMKSGEGVAEETGEAMTMLRYGM
jgi:hypothetical protein